MGEVVVLQGPAPEEDVDEAEAGLGPVPHGHRHGPVEGHDGRGRRLVQEVVEGEDPRPVRGPWLRRLGMDRRDGGLEGVGPETAGGEGRLHPLPPFRDEIPVPEGAVLVLQQDQLPLRRAAGPAAGFLKQHEGEEALDLGLRQQLQDEAAQADRLRRQVRAREALPRGSGIALVEDEVDDAEDGVQALG